MERTVKKDIPVKVAILDNSVNPLVYKPVEHWAPHLDVPWEAFVAREGKLPSLGAGFSHVIVTGSEATILERESWADREAEFVKDAHERGLALLGSCWGHQLLAFALDGPQAVGRCRRPEIGWIEIERRSDSGLLGPRGGAFSFSLHFDEVVNAPGRFEVLASTPTCPVQAMALPGGRAWGLQIHPEIDVEAARALLAGLIGADPSLDPLYRKALEAAPRDSGLVGGIVRYFLAS